MDKFFIFIALIVFGRNGSACSNYDDADCQVTDALQENYFSNLWQVHVDGNDNVAEQVAQDLGFQLVGPVRIVCLFCQSHLEYLIRSYLRTRY